MDGDLLLRLGGCEFSVSDGKRDFPAGNPRAGDCPVLFSGDGGGRSGGAVAFWVPDRLRIAHEYFLWILGGGDFDVCCGSGGSAMRAQS